MCEAHHLYAELPFSEYFHFQYSSNLSYSVHLILPSPLSPRVIIHTPARIQYYRRVRERI